MTLIAFNRTFERAKHRLTYRRRKSEVEQNKPEIYNKTWYFKYLGGFLLVLKSPSNQTRVVNLVGDSPTDSPFPAARFTRQNSPKNRRIFSGLVTHVHCRLQVPPHRPLAQNPDCHGRPGKFVCYWPPRRQRRSAAIDPRDDRGVAKR